jgi:hypothetical protein
MDATHLRMTKPGEPPSAAQIAAWMGRDAYKIWKRVARLIERNYPDIFYPEWLFGGPKTWLVPEVQEGKIFLHLDSGKKSFRPPGGFRFRRAGESGKDPRRTLRAHSGRLR